MDPVVIGVVVVVIVVVLVFSGVLSGSPEFKLHGYQIDYLNTLSKAQSLGGPGKGHLW
jgi:hypothetical protein